MLTEDAFMVVLFVLLHRTRVIAGAVSKGLTRSSVDSTNWKKSFIMAVVCTHQQNAQPDR